MCAKDCGQCVDCRETDTWPVPAELKQPPTASVSGSCEPAPAEPVHAPALTADGFKGALLAAARKRAAAHRALRRDGGEPDDDQ